MIQLASTLAFPRPAVVRTAPDFSRLADRLRDEAVQQLAAAMVGVTGKRLERASVPGCGRHGVSRALNGDASNPLYRIAALFLVMKRMGMGREAEIDEVLGSPESEKVPA